MPGLQLIGPIAATPKLPSPDPAQRGYEDIGMLIMADVLDAPQYSGMQLGTRWLCRLQGPVLELPIDWPNGITWKYWPDEESARGMYSALRQHIFLRFPGVEARDDRANVPLNVPGAYAESFWQNGSEILRLVYDRMTDLQIAVRQTDCVRRFPAHPSAPDSGHIINYSTQSDVCYVAIARGQSGAAEHVLLVYSPRHQPEPVVSQGMPGAERQADYSTGPFKLRSGFLVAFWGRVSGPEVMAPVRGGDPAAMLHQYLGDRVAAPLVSNVPGLDERVAAPVAWAIRVEPGEWRTHYYTLDPRPGEGYSFCCISRVGAPDFQPASAGNAGGRIIGGMTLQQYAMMAVERERVLMTAGQNAAPQLTAVARKYGQPIPDNVLAYAARIVDWDLAIQGSPQLSAEFLAQRTIATMRLDGHNPTEQQIQQIVGQQQQVQAQLASAAQAHGDATKELFDGSCKLIEMARTLTPPQIVEAAKSIFTHVMKQDGSPAYAFDRIIWMLTQPGYQNNPKFPNVDQVTEKIARAHWSCMSPADQKQAGKEDKYVKSVIADVYEKNGLPVPGVGGFLSRLMDKM
jgi:hypothetical protein